MKILDYTYGLKRLFIIENDVVVLLDKIVTSLTGIAMNIFVKKQKSTFYFDGIF